MLTCNWAKALLANTSRQEYPLLRRLGGLNQRQCAAARRRPLESSDIPARDTAWSTTISTASFVKSLTILWHFRTRLFVRASLSKLIRQTSLGRLGKASCSRALVSPVRTADGIPTGIAREPAKTDAPSACHSPGLISRQNARRCEKARHAYRTVRRSEMFTLSLIGSTTSRLAYGLRTYT